MAEAALKNEYLTRERVEQVEQRLKSLMVDYVNLVRLVSAVDDQLSRGFWGRLRWLLLGR
jgi:hypothetical protein